MRAVLQVPPRGPATWLKISPMMVREARASGMLLQFNALFEGLAINPAGDQMWLAAERESRGSADDQAQADGVGLRRRLCAAERSGHGNATAAVSQAPEPSTGILPTCHCSTASCSPLSATPIEICRRDAVTAKVERCWSFADEVLQENRRYPQDYGLTEALIVDADGAWIGVDNNYGARADGEYVRSSGASLHLKVAGAPSHEPANAGQACRSGVDGVGLVRRVVSGDAVFRPVGSASAKPECGGQLGARRWFRRSETDQQRPGTFRCQRPDQRPAGEFHARYRGDRRGDPGGHGASG